MFDRRAVVTGAGGFIGHHLVKRLKREGYWVRGVDLVPPRYEASAADEFLPLDLRSRGNCIAACRSTDEVYQLAADMGGIGYISGHFATICRNNSLINLHLLEAARHADIEKYFFASSACVYNQSKQCDAQVTALREEDAYPAQAEKGYGWEKLYAELLCQYYREEFGLPTHVARFHNVYGPLGTYEGGREKAPAAVCRKIAQAASGSEVEVWGDGQQSRSFMYIDDCLEGILRLVRTGITSPLNLGSGELITINELYHLVANIAGKEIRLRHTLDRPQGVRGRNSDNRRIRKLLGWEPEVSLEDGLEKTYAWIESQVHQGRHADAAASSGNTHIVGL